jgi:hypothetical protein
MRCICPVHFGILVYNAAYEGYLIGRLLFGESNIFLNNENYIHAHVLNSILYPAIKTFPFHIQRYIQIFCRFKITWRTCKWIAPVKTCRCSAKIKQSQRKKYSSSFILKNALSTSAITNTHLFIAFNQPMNL